MGEGVVIAATCGGWAWENECSRNVVFDHTASWRHQNALYLHTVRKDCVTATAGGTGEVGVSNKRRAAAVEATNLNARSGVGGVGGVGGAVGGERATALLGERVPSLPSGRKCRAPSYEETVQRLARQVLGRPIALEAQKVWNFGLTRFNLTEWRRRNMTAVFQAFLAANYEHRVWPETSLSFGLGISYMAFADRVRCWDR